MKKLLVLLLITAVFGCKESKEPKEMKTSFYVGTYTNGESEGIYKYQIDKKGFLSKVGLQAITSNPSFITKTEDGKTLLAVDETNVEGTGFVKSFQIQEDSLVFVSQSKSGGAHPCFITVNSQNQVLVANYTGGNVGFLELNKQGVLSELLDVQQHTGKGTTDRQQSPHAHSTWFHPTKEEIISVDLGTNDLWFSNIDKVQKKMKYTAQKNLKMKAGAGPRHLAFHPNNKWIYVLNELSNTVAMVQKKEGAYATFSEISTLPKDYSEYSKGADIHVSNDGNFVYTSNRGHNSIVIYKVNNQNGFLELEGFESVKGVNPRNFSLTPDNQYIIVANRDTNNLVSFKRNSTTGLLTFVSEIKAPNPVCIVF